MVLSSNTPSISDSLFKAQFGEDCLLYKYFANKQNGFYVEVGACDGIYASNTFFFEQIGWTGILIEASPSLAQKCLQARPRSCVVSCAVVPPNSPAAVTFEIVEGWEALSSLSVCQDKFYNYQPAIQKVSVAAKTLDTILEECKVREIDFLTIDVEGHDWGVLQGFTISKWQPQVVIIERWSPLPDAKIMNYMHSNGYLYMRTTGRINDWFCRSAAASPHNLLYKLQVALLFYLPAYITFSFKNAARVVSYQLGMLSALRKLANYFKSKNKPGSHGS